jgi:hypothetical protein
LGVHHGGAARSYLRETLAAELVNRLPVAVGLGFRTRCLPPGLAVAWLERGVNAQTPEL